MKLRLKISSNKLDRAVVYVLVCDEKSTLNNNISNIANYINNISNIANYSDNIVKVYLVVNNDRAEIPLHNVLSDYLNPDDHIFCEFEDINNDKQDNNNDKQDLKRRKTVDENSNNENSSNEKSSNEKSSNEMDLSTDHESVVMFDQPRTKTIEIFYQTYPMLA